MSLCEYVKERTADRIIICTMEFTHSFDKAVTVDDTTKATNSSDDHRSQQQQHSNFSKHTDDFYRKLIETDTDTPLQLVEDILAGNLTFLDFIRSLESLLVSDDISIRGGALKIITNTLNALPIGFLNAQAIEELTLFFCSRFDDHHSFIPTILKGFLSLVEMEALPDGVCVNIFRALNNHFSPHSQLVADKLTCYRILSVMIRRKSDELLKLGADFIEGYLNMIEGERDPRNLMFVFGQLPLLFKNFSLHNLTEQAFETAANYFPIDFQSSAKSEITRTDLSKALSPCLTAIDEFCPFAVPLLLDKISSSLRVAQIDSLELLISCFDQFSPNKLCQFVNEINSELLNILKPIEMNSEVRELCLRAFAKFVAYLSNHDRISELENVLNTILSRFEHFLNDFNSPHYSFALTIVSRISSCSSAASFILVKLLPNLLRLDRQSALSNVNFLGSLKSLLHPCVIFKIDCSSTKELQSTWQQIPPLLVKFCEDTNIQLRLQAFDSVSSIVQLFDLQQRYDLYEVLCRNIINDDNIVTRTECAKCIRTVAEIYPDEISNHLKERLKSTERINLNNDGLIRRIFQCWCAVSPVNGFIPFLRDSITINLQYSQYGSFVIESLKDLLLAEKSNSEFVGKLHHEGNLLWHLLDWWQQGCEATDENSIFNDENVADNLRLIISILMRSLDASSQLIVVNRYFQSNDGKIDRNRLVQWFNFSRHFRSIRGDSHDSLDLSLSLSIVILEGIVTGILPQVLAASSLMNSATVIEDLITISLHCCRTYCCSAACRCLATIMNKIEKDVDTKEHAHYVRLQIIEVVTKSNSVLKTNGARLSAYVTKGLLCSGFVESNLWLDLLLSLIVDDDVGDFTADSFRIIVEDDEYFISSFNHCSVKLFYRQRLFSYIVPKLTHLCRTNSEKSVKVRCARSIVHLLKNIAECVVSTHLKEILLSTIEILEPNGDQEILCQLFDALSPLIVKNKTIFEDYIATFVTKSLSIACKAPFMGSRIAALECLRELAKLNPITILRYQRQVIHELKTCLDDKKRLVRSKATETRTRWEIIGTPK